MLHVLYVTYMLYVTYSPKSITYVIDNICDSISYNMKIKRWINGVKSCCPKLTSAAHCEPTHTQGH